MYILIIYCCFLLKFISLTRFFFFLILFLCLLNKSETQAAAVPNERSVRHNEHQKQMLALNNSFNEDTPSGLQVKDLCPALQPSVYGCLTWEGIINRKGEEKLVEKAKELKMNPLHGAWNVGKCIQQILNAYFRNY